MEWGGAILAKLAYEDVKYVLCETFNLQNEVAAYYEDGRIDRVFVTDLWLDAPMLSTIANDEQLKDKFFVFNHHKSVLEGNTNIYPFTTIQISDEKELCSGTSLFYEYLVRIGLIDGLSQAIYDFSELTRKYDTWEWKTKYDGEMPHELSLLFDAVGCEGYITLLYEKLRQSKNESFSFTELEKMLIQNKIAQVEEKIENYAKKVYYSEILGYKAGIVFIDYEYRNDLAEYFRQQGYDMDFAMLIALDSGTVSYRSIKDDMNVRLIAEAMGGKGHDKAASSPISEEQKKVLVKILTNYQ